VTTVASQASPNTVNVSSSSASTARPHRSFVPTRSPTYRQGTSATGGSHVAGSWSAFERFDRAVTVIRVSGLRWSFAYASLRAALQPVAPAGRARHSSRALFLSEAAQRRRTMPGSIVRVTAQDDEPVTVGR
jgi:hypothetical protein